MLKWRMIRILCFHCQVSYLARVLIPIVFVNYMNALQFLSLCSFFKVLTVMCCDIDEESKLPCWGMSSCASNTSYKEVKSTAATLWTFWESVNNNAYSLYKVHLFCPILLLFSGKSKIKFLLNAFVLIFALKHLKHFSCQTNSLITSLIFWNQQLIRHSDSVNCYLCHHYSEPFCVENTCAMWRIALLHPHSGH